MAQTHKGEVSLVVHGQTYTLVLTTHAMSLLEQHYSTPTHEATWEEAWNKSAMSGTVRGIVVLIWAMAQEHHEGLTPRDVERLIDDVGGLDKLKDILEAAAQAARIDGEDAKELAKHARPPKAQSTLKRAGNSGGVFTSMRDGSA